MDHRYPDTYREQCIRLAYLRQLSSRPSHRSNCNSPIAKSGMPIEFVSAKENLPPAFIDNFLNDRKKADFVGEFPGATKRDYRRVRRQALVPPISFKPDHGGTERWDAARTRRPPKTVRSEVGCGDEDHGKAGLAPSSGNLLQRAIAAVRDRGNARLFVPTGNERIEDHYGNGLRIVVSPHWRTGSR